MAYLLSHAFALVFLIGILGLPGWWLAPRETFGIQPALRPLARLVLGLGFWIVCLFGLAICGLLRPWALWAVIFGVIAGAVFHGVRSRESRSGESRSGGSRSGKLIPRLSAPQILGGILGIAVLAPLGFLAMTPTVSWDANTYHLTLPKLFLDHGGFREVPLNVYSYWPLNVQLLFALALAIDGFVLAKLLHFAFGIATLYALAAGARAFHRPVSGPLAAMLFVANGVVIYELRVAYVDLAHAFFLLAGVLFMIEALEREPRALWLSGLSCGLAAGVKLNGLMGAGLVGALYLPRLIDELRQRGPEAAKIFLTRFLVPILALWTPWVVRTTMLTGNPGYPLLHRWFGGPDWSSTLTDRLQAWQSSIGMGREPVDYLLLPLRVILAGGQGYERFDGESAAFWIVLVPLALWAARSAAEARSARLLRGALTFAGLYFVFWGLSSQQMRLLIPAMPLLALAGSMSLIELTERIKAPRWRQVAVATLFTATFIFLVGSQGRVLAAGYRTLAVYLQAQGDLTSRAAHPVYAFINSQLPADAKLLFLNTNQRFFCEREVLADSFFEASQIADWLAPAEDAAAVRELLDQQGVSHILVEHRFRGAVYPETLLELLQDPHQVHQVFRSDDGRFSVFVLL